MPSFYIYIILHMVNNMRLPHLISLTYHSYFFLRLFTLSEKPVEETPQRKRSHFSQHQAYYAALWL